MSEFAECVRALGTQDALLLGGSGDVNMWVRPDGEAPGTTSQDVDHAEEGEGEEQRAAGVCTFVVVPFVRWPAQDADAPFAQKRNLTTNLAAQLMWRRGTS